MGEEEILLTCLGENPIIYHHRTDFEDNYNDLVVHLVTMIEGGNKNERGTLSEYFLISQVCLTVMIIQTPYPWFTNWGCLDTWCAALNG